MSRGVVQTVNLVGEGKILVIDQDQVEKGVELCRLIKVGKPLPKGQPPGPENIYVARVVRFKGATTGTESADGGATKTIYTLTRNEQGKFKHHWDEKTNGPRPKKEKKKTDGPAKEKKKRDVEEMLKDVDKDALIALLAGVQKKKAKGKKAKE